MRYRFRCEYLGSAFYGWQAQNEGGKTKFVTVQSALEEAFSVALRTPIRITGSGRTDTGVHARGQCVHFDFDGRSRQQADSQTYCQGTYHFCYAESV